MNGCAGLDASRPETPHPGTASAPTEALRLSLSRQPTERICIAYSGGRDSSALLHAAAWLIPFLPPAQRPQLCAVHVNHGLHAEAADWTAHCRACCAALGVPIQVREVDAAPQPGQSPEEAARAARWSAWEQLLAPGEQLWIAQHQDDQAETLLLALLRGAGVKGLAGIPRSRALGEGLALRPWLDLSAAQIAAYASEQGLTWIEDPSNQNTAFDRNYLRHRILPLLQQRWPAAPGTLARAAAHCAEAAELIESASANWLAEVQGSQPHRLSVSKLLSMPRARRHALLRHWLAVRGFRMPSQRRLEQVSHSLLSARADASPLVTWSGCELRRYRDDLFALAPLPPPPVGEFTWDGSTPLNLGNQLGDRLGDRLGELSLPGFRLATDIESASPLGTDGLSIRFGVTGLRCRPRPDGPSRALKALFQQQGVPAWLRPFVPMVFAGEHLLALAGVALCDERLKAVCWRHSLGPGLGLIEVLSQWSQTR